MSIMSTASVIQWSLALPAKFKLPTIASQVIPTSKAEASSLYEL